MKIPFIFTINFLALAGSVFATDEWSTPALFSGYTTYTTPSIVYLNDNTVTNIWGMTSWTAQAGIYRRLQLDTYQPLNFDSNSGWYTRVVA